MRIPLPLPLPIVLIIVFLIGAGIGAVVATQLTTIGASILIVSMLVIVAGCLVLLLVSIVELGQGLGQDNELE